MPLALPDQQIMTVLKKFLTPFPPPCYLRRIDLGIHRQMGFVFDRGAYLSRPADSISLVYTIDEKRIF